MKMTGGGRTGSSFGFWGFGFWVREGGKEGEWCLGFGILAKERADGERGREGGREGISCDSQVKKMSSTVEVSYLS